MMCVSDRSTSIGMLNDRSTSIGMLNDRSTFTSTDMRTMDLRNCFFFGGLVASRSVCVFCKSSSSPPPIFSNHNRSWMKILLIQ
jgi:hypothetical protein